MSAFKTIIISIIVGTLFGAGAMSLLQSSNTDTIDKTPEAKKPLYWVAPMDPTYIRNEPGKSPMGMDLVPVYEEEGEEKEPTSTIRIDPVTIQNMGVRLGDVERKALTKEMLPPTVVEAGNSTNTSVVAGFGNIWNPNEPSITSVDVVSNTMLIGSA